MNQTYDVLSKWTRRKKTQIVAEKLTRVLNKQDFKTALSALLLVLAEVHLDANRGEHGDVCVPCTNSSLTELLQTLRGFSDQMIDDVPSGMVSKVPHHEDKKEEG